MSACDHLFYDRAHVPDDNLVPPYGGAGKPSFRPTSARQCANVSSVCPHFRFPKPNCTISSCSARCLQPVDGFMGVTYQSARAGRAAGRPALGSAGGIERVG